ncbi:LOW QUALITY PROTEIN: hypothetical protein M8C21_003577, partial [Ambrosia artemisiifolia]
FGEKEGSGHSSGCLPHWRRSHNNACLLKTVVAAVAPPYRCLLSRFVPGCDNPTAELVADVQEECAKLDEVESVKIVRRWLETKLTNAPLIGAHDCTYGLRRKDLRIKTFPMTRKQGSVTREKLGTLINTPEENQEGKTKSSHIQSHPE